jgi:ligand-binding SRPBCC domain-containing protein
MKSFLIVHVSTDLDAPPDRVWEALKKVDTLRYITRGLLGFRPLGPVADTLRGGEVVRVRLLFFHVIPAWAHEIRIVGVDEEAHVIETREHGGGVKTWNHTLTVEPAGDGRSRYTDRIEIDAGATTRLVWAYANLFYRYRQRRWRRLARGL